MFRRPFTACTAQYGTAQFAQQNGASHVVRTHHSATMQAKARRVAETHQVVKHFLQLVVCSNERIHRNLLGQKTSTTTRSSYA